MEVKRWACLRVDLSIAVEVVDAVAAHVNNLDRARTQALYSTITELVANITQHAYPDNFKPVQDLACEIAICETASGSLVITVLDYGVTIPQSILNEISKEHDLTISSHTKTDVQIIADAVFSTKLSTKQSGRGRGLNSIFDFVSKGFFQSIKISSRRGTLYCTNEKNELSADTTLRVGTSVEIVIFPKIVPTEFLQHGDIDIAKEFSKYPAGRYLADGAHSAEAFLNDFLSPALEKYQTVTVSLDGTYGYGASFLEEAFAGLIRHGHSASSLKGRLNLISNEDFHLPHQVWTYIDEASK